jgi:hypothetical protein
VIFPGWEHDVPFSVTNRAAAGEIGEPAVAAVRRFEFRSGARQMTDLISIAGGELIDRIGTGGVLEASFTAFVEGGGLTLASRRVSVRIGRVHVRIPVAVAPVVRLTERYDDVLNCQRVALTIDAPLLGRLYEYSGTFRYSVDTGGEP